MISINSKYSSSFSNFIFFKQYNIQNNYFSFARESPEAVIFQAFGIYLKRSIRFFSLEAKLTNLIRPSRITEDLEGFVLFRMDKRAAVLSATHFS
jgi:hypothetical protein